MPTPRHRNHVKLLGDGRCMTHAECKDHGVVLHHAARDTSLQIMYDSFALSLQNQEHIKIAVSLNRGLRKRFGE